MGEVGVHLADDVRGSGERALHPIHVRPSEPTGPLAMHDIDPPRPLPRQLVGDLARAVRGPIVHDHQVVALAGEDRRHELRKVLPLVVRRNDHLHVHERPSRSAEICSDTSATRNTTTEKRMSSTDEFVMWLCVAIVHNA